MFQKNYKKLTSRQRSLLKKLRKAQARWYNNLKNGSLTKMTHKQRAKLAARLQRYHHQLRCLGLPLRVGATGAALSLALSMPSTLHAQPFVEQTGSDNPFNGVGVGIYSHPTFVDIDNDGDFDAFIGEYSGTILFYKNTGTNAAPIFTPQTSTDNPLYGETFGERSKPTFVDIDNDGDFDAFKGESFGTILYYENTGTNTAPIFTSQAGTDNPFDGVDIGDNPTPTFVDIDNDGDFDAFIGEYYGTILYYENTGTNTAPIFTSQASTDNPFDGVDVGINSAPTFVDIDNDGDFDAFSGELFGTILYYENTGTNTAPIFTSQTGTDNPFNGVGVGLGSAPTFVDIDNDGDFDAFIGEFYGTILYYENNLIMLPVELSHFRATAKAGQANLTWQTATEINNEGFEVQWANSIEQVTIGAWQTIGFVNGNGTTNEAQDYQFAHERPATGTNYYRLKQIDFDGKFEYSPIVSVEVLGKNNDFVVAPNPVVIGGTLTIRLSDNKAGEMVLYNALGAAVAIQRVAENQEVIKMQLADLPKGVYSLVFAAKGQQKVKRVVVR